LKKKQEAAKCRSNQRDGISTPAHHPEIRKCILDIDVLENAVQSSDLSEPALIRIFDAHRQMIELRAAGKLNAGILEPDGSVRVAADDI
jgi:hypothetical protein